MRTKKVYLCGKINQCNESECMGWRVWFKSQAVNILWIDPTDRDYRGKERDHYKEIVEFDKKQILTADLLLMNFLGPSVGSSMEVFMAWSVGIPVIVVNELSKNLSPWIVYHASVVVENKEKAIKKLLEWETC